MITARYTTVLDHATGLNLIRRYRELVGADGNAITVPQPIGDEIDVMIHADRSVGYRVVLRDEYERRGLMP